MGWFDDEKGNPVDRFFTWGAETFTPKLCQTEEHWTSRVTAILFTECPCCLMWRSLIVGFIFGIVLTKSEAVSWYRIYEMFQFQSFHMYGIIMVAIAVGTIGVQYMKRNHIKDINGQPIVITDKEPGSFRYWIGGLFFGLGWALTGACPGPMFVNIGHGYYPMLIVIFGALVGTYLYGVIKNKLPH